MQADSHILAGYGLASASDFVAPDGCTNHHVCLELSAISADSSVTRLVCAQYVSMDDIDSISDKLLVACWVMVWPFRASICSYRCHTMPKT